MSTNQIIENEGTNNIVNSNLVNSWWCIVVGVTLLKKQDKLPNVCN